MESLAGTMVQPSTLARVPWGKCAMLALMAMTGAITVFAVTGCNVQTRSGIPGPVDEDAPEEFSTTPSGLQYRILRQGNGKKPGVNDSVVVDYVGKLDSNMEFDNSYKRRDPTSFALRNVVAGWTEGLQLVSEGGMIELKIPPQLGYGSTPPHGSGIPIGATLNFIVELHEIQ